MKQDILEQLVEDWLQAKGYFTRANLKFAPSKDSLGYVEQLDRIPSDIDVIGIHPGKQGAERVYAVNCKSWQDGFDIAKTARKLCEMPEAMIGGKPHWKHFRELVVPRWTDAFLQALRDTTNNDDQFTYVTAVTFACDPHAKDAWELNSTFKAALCNNPIRFVTLREMLSEVFSGLGTTVESSQFSRSLQLFKAAGIDLRIMPCVTTPDAIR